MGASAVFQIAELDQRIDRLRAEMREVAIAPQALRAMPARSG